MDIFLLSLQHCHSVWLLVACLSELSFIVHQGQTCPKCKLNHDPLVWQLPQVVVVDDMFLSKIPIAPCYCQMMG